jgi:hypothetical protein
MKYKELLSFLKKVDRLSLNDDVAVYVGGLNEFFPVTEIRSAEGSDVLDDGHLYFIVNSRGDYVTQVRELGQPNVRDIERTLEDAVDSTSLAEVLGMLADICLGKAEHLESNWQDRASARVWERAAKVLNDAVNKVDV